MVSNRRVLFLYKLEINRIERIYWFKVGTDRNEYRERCDDSVFGYGEGRGSHGRQSAAFAGRDGASPLQTVGGRVRFLGQSG